MKLYLIAAKGKHKGTPIPIKADLFLLGSERVCQLRSSYPEIGGQHCAIVTREHKVFVRDLDSGHATLVNENAMPAGEEWPLHAGDRLSVGPLEFMVQFHEADLSQQNAENWALKLLDKAGEEKKREEQDDLYKAGTRRDSAADAAASIIGRLENTRGEVKGRLRVFTEGDTIVVRLNDPHLVDEAEIALVRTELNDQLAKVTHRVLVDLRNVQRMSSMAIGMIIGLYRQLKARKIPLAVCQVSPDVLPVFEVVGMGKLVRCFPDKTAALEAKW